MKRSKHSLSRTIIGTANLGELVPCGWWDILPGDSLQISGSVLLRSSPLLSPPMHPVIARLHYIYVPLRILWNEGTTNFENFITGGLAGTDASTPPTITVNSGSGWAIGSLADYLEIPTGVDDLPVSALPFRAYAKIWNELYRDEQLQTALTIDYTDGADSTTNTTLQNVCWEKDYLTSARPSAQLGSAVTIPIGTTAVVKTSSSRLVTGGQQPMTIWNVSDGSSGSANWNLGTGSDGARLSVYNGSPGTGQYDAYPGNLYADLASVTGIPINDLREALAMQRYMENRNRYGARFVEYLASLGVKSSDARLQRPEYICGGKSTIQFSEVLQSGVTTSGTPSTGVGSMLGHGLGALRTRPARRFFEEHGILMALLSVRPKTMYVNGLHKKFSRTSKEDYWQKEFEHIGSQPVKNKEVRWAHATPEGTFGYQDPYDEYRRSENYVSGDFRSSLNYWHYGRIFASDPTLNAAFVSADPTTRVYQSTSADNMYYMVRHSIQARRLISKMGSSFTY